MESTEDMKIEAPESAQPVIATDPSESDGNKEIPITRLHPCSDGKTRNDEQYEIYKKYEEALVLKKEQFKKDPDQFVHLDDIVMGVINGDKGQGCYFGRFTLLESKAAFVTMQYRFFNSLTEMDYAMEMKKKEKLIVTAPEAGKIIV